jgi:hypothetical protein
MEGEIDRLGKFNVYVKRVSDNSCEIKINSVFEQHYRFGDVPSVMKKSCVSTGELEAEIYKQIQEKIK